MPLKVFINDHGLLADKSSNYIKGRTEGLWNCILSEDFDSDGDKDFIFGNMGQNNQWKVSEDRPASLVYSDFDKNGSVDPLLNYYVEGKSFPYPSRDELAEQLPAFKKRFTDYRSYSDAAITDVLQQQELSSAKQLNAYTLSSVYVENGREGLKIKPMPLELQFAPVFAMTSMDVNKDGNPDLVSGGNMSATRARTGKLTGNTGFVFLGNGKGDFRFLHPAESGILIRGDARNMATDGNRLFVAVNNAPLLVYELR
jgi:hypothetical protein